jgi:hypothetical protein
MYFTPYASNSVLSAIRASADIVGEKDDLTTYLGFCAPGTTGTNQPAWSILKIVQSGTVQPIVTRFLWAGGLCAYNFKWDDRATLDYQFKNF